jgi:hypothetical protein
MIVREMSRQTLFRKQLDLHIRQALLGTLLTHVGSLLNHMEGSEYVARASLDFDESTTPNSAPLIRDDTYYSGTQACEIERLCDQWGRE